MSEVRSLKCFLCFETVPAGSRLKTWCNRYLGYAFRICSDCLDRKGSGILHQFETVRTRSELLSHLFNCSNQKFKDSLLERHLGAHLDGWVCLEMPVMDVMYEKWLAQRD